MTEICRMAIGDYLKDYIDVKPGYLYSEEKIMLSGKLNDAPSGRLFRADFRTLQMCQSL